MIHNSVHSRRRFQGSSLDTIGGLDDLYVNPIVEHDLYFGDPSQLNSEEDSSTRNVRPNFRGYIDGALMSQFYDLR